MNMKQIHANVICAVIFLLTSLQVQAMQIKGVKIEEATQVGGSSLVLNGAGVRTTMMFKVYVAALYLGQKQTEANAIISDHSNKRITLHFLREVSSDMLLHGMDEGFAANNTIAEMAAIEPQLREFRKLMASAKEVKEGDEILLDFMPTFTQFSYNGRVMGKIESEAFDQALLRVWLGAHAVDSSLKRALLGQMED